LKALWKEVRDAVAEIMEKATFEELAEKTKAARAGRRRGA
jgi:DNA-binding IscR family transcriptional regulator